MKYVFTLLLFVTVAISLSGQPCKSKYKNQLEENSKLITCETNYTIEKLKNGRYIKKIYYPETKVMTKLVTFKDDKFLEKHGLYKEYRDDGTLVNKGEFVNNLKEGTWILSIYETGEFINDKKVGIWKTIRSDSIVSQEEMYVDGELDGKQIKYDSLGIITMEQVFRKGQLVSTTRDTTIIIDEKFPVFAGCEDINMSDEEIKKCSTDNCLKYLYGALKYPQKAREQNIEGRGIFQFVIDETGSVDNIKAVNGISKEIEEEVFKLIKNMPTWKPGTKNGKPVRVLMSIPVVFKLG